MADRLVNVYENEYAEFGENRIISRVKYNSILDYWDGHNWTNGGTGRHKGLTKLKDGRYVLIEGTQWQGQRNFAFVISKERALQEILESGKTELLARTKWEELKQLLDETMIEEDDEE